VCGRDFTHRPAPAGLVYGKLTAATDRMEIQQSSTKPRSSEGDIGFREAWARTRRRLPPGSSRRLQSRSARPAGRGIILQPCGQVLAVHIFEALIEQDKIGRNSCAGLERIRPTGFLAHDQSDRCLRERSERSHSVRSHRPHGRIRSAFIGHECCGTADSPAGRTNNIEKQRDLRHFRDTIGGGPDG